MPILGALQSAAVVLISRKPTAFFASTDTFEMEISNLSSTVAKDIAKAHDWRRLTTLNTFSGDGVAAGFSLPSDYDRMPVKADVHSANFATWRYTPTRDLDQWIDFQNGLAVPHPGAWIILGAQMQFYPVISTGEVAKFYYITKNYATAAGGDPKAAFTRDDDEFLLDNDLLTLGLIWRWRAQKKLEYAEDMANYEKALAEIVGREKGPRILHSGPPRMPGDFRYAYPGALG